MAITYDAVNNRILGDGFSEVTPMDYDDFVTADRAGSYEILAAIATALNITLDNAIRPVESLALLITFTLTGTNAGAGDTIDVTGTDAWAGALSESIDVSAGDGAYATTKRFRTITDIDCTGFADGVGTVSATQPQWGVVWENRGSQGKFDCPVYFGTISDGYCAFEHMQICRDYEVSGVANRTGFSVPTGSQLRFGKVNDATHKASENHTSLIFHRDVSAYVYGFDGSGEFLCYGLALLQSNSWMNQLRVGGANNKFWNIVFSDNLFFRSFRGDFFNCTCTGSGYYFGRHPYSVTLDQIKVLSCPSTFRLQGSITLSGFYGRGNTQLFSLEYYRGTSYIIAADTDTWVITGNLLAGSHYIYRQEYCDLHVVNEDGNDWTSKTVEMKDNDGDEAFSVSTDGSGEIAQQTVTYIIYGFGDASDENEFPHVINLYDGATLIHTLTGLIIDGPMKRRIEIPASYPAEADVENGVNYGSGLTGDLVVPAEAQVLDGVGFGGGSGSEHTGTVVQPAVGDVQESVTFGPGSGLTGVLGLPAESEVKTNVGFGENDTEFTGALIVPQSPLGIDLEIDGPLEIAVALGDLDVAVEIDGPLEIAVALSDLDVAVEISDLDVAVEVA